MGKLYFGGLTESGWEKDVAMEDVVDYINSFDMELINASIRNNQLVIEVYDGIDDHDVVLMLNTDGYNSVFGWHLGETWGDLLEELDDNCPYDKKIAIIAEMLIRYISSEIITNIDISITEFIYLNNFMNAKFNKLLAWSGNTPIEWLKKYFDNASNSFHLG